jgi:hypothetical protein
MAGAFANLVNVPTAELLSAAGRRLRSLQLEPPTPKKLAPCAHCGAELGARERRKHEPKCRRAQQATPAHGALPGRSRDGLEPELLTGTALTVELAVREVMERCRLAGSNLAGILAYRAELDAGAGNDYSAWAELAIAAYLEYCKSLPMLTRDWSANILFGCGFYLNRSEWGWKDGEQPTAAPDTLRQRANGTEPRW